MHIFLIVLIIIGSLIFLAGYLWGWVVLFGEFMDVPAYQQDQMLAYACLLATIAGVFWWIILIYRLFKRHNLGDALFDWDQSYRH